MVGFRPLRHPARFLGLFALLLACLLPVWDRLSVYYLAGLVEVVNLLLRSMDAPFPVRLGHAAPDTVYPAVAGGMALLLATPSLPARERFKWLAALLALLCLFHVTLLYLETRAAVAHHLDPSEAGTPWAMRSAAVTLVKAWGTPVLVVLTWFAAVRPRGSGPPLTGRSPAAALCPRRSGRCRTRRWCGAPHAARPHEAPPLSQAASSSLSRQQTATQRTSRAS